MFFAVAHLLNLEVDLLLLHTTRTYFERDGEDDDAEDRWGLRRYGHSKDSRPDLPQIIIGLAVTREGIPVRIWCWPGNTSDQALPQVKDDLPTWRGGRVVTVVDRGFSSAADLADPGPRAGPAARGHPHRADRHGHPDHRADHRPAGHSSGLRAHPTAPNHRPTPGLTCATPQLGSPERVVTRLGRRSGPIAAGQPPNSATSSTYQLRNDRGLLAALEGRKCPRCP